MLLIVVPVTVVVLSQETLDPVKCMTEGGGFPLGGKEENGGYNLARTQQSSFHCLRGAGGGYAPHHFEFFA